MAVGIVEGPETIEIQQHHAVPGIRIDHQQRLQAGMEGAMVEQTRKRVPLGLGGKLALCGFQLLDPALKVRHKAPVLFSQPPPFRRAIHRRAELLRIPERLHQVVVDVAGLESLYSGLGRPMAGEDDELRLRSDCGGAPDET